MNRHPHAGDKSIIPPPQNNLRVAAAKAVDRLRSQSARQLAWLGARCDRDVWRVGVLDGDIEVDFASGAAVTDGVQVSPSWQVLVLHYLAVREQPAHRQPTITFAELPDARTYAGVYRQRVNVRFCATAGRGAEGFRAAAVTLGGRAASGGDAAFDFDIFPRLSLRLIWHGPDDEFAPSATLLLPDSIESFFCVEDIVVLSERLVSRLTGRPF
jgi:hypothetical protein